MEEALYAQNYRIQNVTQNNNNDEGPVKLTKKKIETISATNKSIIDGGEKKTKKLKSIKVALYNDKLIKTQWGLNALKLDHGFNM